MKITDLRGLVQKTRVIPPLQIRDTQLCTCMLILHAHPRPSSHFLESSDPFPLIAWIEKEHTHHLSHEATSENDTSSELDHSKYDKLWMFWQGLVVCCMHIICCSSSRDYQSNDNFHSKCYTSSFKAYTFWRTKWYSQRVVWRDSTILTCTGWVRQT